MKSSWLPGKKSKAYFDKYDDIEWDKEDKGVAIAGKARMSTVTRLLSVEETVKAVRTPIGKRDEKTFRYCDN